MTIFAETPRLILRELVPEDAPGMFALDSNPAVLRYIGVPPQTDMEQSRAIIEFVRAQYRDNGIGRWAVILKESGEFIGWSGLKLIRETVNGHSNYYDLGYRFREEFWGKGYGFEAARACLNYGFDTLQLPVIYAIVKQGNTASHRIIQKLGFRFNGTYEDSGEEIAWYEKWREETSI